MCGSLAGVAVALTGHPLDSVKVRMQESGNILTMRGVMSKTFVNEGFLGFYKGLGPPLTTVPLVNSIVFASYETAKKVMGVQSEADFTFN